MWRGTLLAKDTAPSGVLGQMAEGTDYVPRTGTYLLHEGEAVIPANENRGAATINVVINGPVYGLDDLDRRLSESIKRTWARGGLAYLGAS